MRKDADVAPALTVTDAGMIASVLPEVMVTTSPAGAAGSLKGTVPWALVPPTTQVELRVTDATVGGVIVSVASWDTVPRVLEIWAFVGVSTPNVLIVKLAVNLPP